MRDRWLTNFLLGLRWTPRWEVAPAPSADFSSSPESKGLPPIVEGLRQADWSSPNTVNLASGGSDSLAVCLGLASANRSLIRG